MTPSANKLATVDSGDTHSHMAGDDRWLPKQPLARPWRRLAKDLDMAVPNAAALLDQFTAAGIAVEVTHRSKRRVVGLALLAPLRDKDHSPRRPETGRGCGRPSNIRDEEVVADPPPLPRLSPFRPWPRNPAPLDHM